MDKISTLLTEKKLLKTPLIISVAFEICRVERVIARIHKLATLSPTLFSKTTELISHVPKTVLHVSNAEKMVHLSLEE